MIVVLSCAVVLNILRSCFVNLGVGFVVFFVSLGVHFNVFWCPRGSSGDAVTSRGPPKGVE